MVLEMLTECFSYVGLPALRRTIKPGNRSSVRNNVTLHVFECSIFFAQFQFKINIS